MITMISTTTVTTVTAIAAMGLTVTLSIAATMLLILLLSTRELVSTRGSGIHMRISKFLIIGIVPLLMTFAVITFIQIALVLS